MIVLYLLLGFVALWISWFVLTGVVSFLFTHPDEAGNPEKGLLIFVESIRWLSVPW